MTCRASLSRSQSGAGLRRAMTNVTDAVQEAVGQTMLYTPQQDLSDVQAVARDQASASTLWGISRYTLRSTW